MSTEGQTDDGLTQRDRDVMEVASGDATDADPEKQIERLREENRALKEEVQDLRDELTATKKTLFSQVNQLREELNGMDPTDPRSGPRYEDLTTLEKYQKMSTARLSDGPSRSSRSASLIF